MFISCWGASDKQVDIFIRQPPDTLHCGGLLWGTSCDCTNYCQALGSAHGWLKAYKKTTQNITLLLRNLRKTQKRERAISGRLFCCSAAWTKKHGGDLITSVCSCGVMVAPTAGSYGVWPRLHMEVSQKRCCIFYSFRLNVMTAGKHAECQVTALSGTFNSFISALEKTFHHL